MSDPDADVAGSHSRLDVDKPDGEEKPEIYVLGYGDNVQRWISRRSAATHAAFLLPHLRPGMRLLDCGCGPGSITVGLAEAVMPGEVIGMDIEPSQLARAEALAAARGLTHIPFVQGSVYALPFPYATFDAVFAHTVLYHVRDPLRALKEFRRILRPGGVAGVRDPDYGRWFFEPATPLLETFRELSLRVAEANGNSSTYSRHLRRLLLDAGFARAALHTSTASCGTAEEVRRASIFDIGRLQAPTFRDTALREGLADDSLLSAIEAELRQWGQRPDASAVVLWHEALGWVSS